MKHRTKKGPTQRQLRVGEQLRHIIAETLSRGDFHDVTVSEVRVTPDLRNANAYVTSFIKEQDINEIIEELNADTHTFQREIGRQLNMKFTPRIRFKFDDSFEEAGRIENLIRDIHMTTNIDTHANEEE